MTRTLVVLDDDPTGTQTVHGVPVLTEWSLDSLVFEMSRSPVFFILTNSRSMSESDAVATATEIGESLVVASRQAGVSLEIISRGDSTLRGHYPVEVDALAKALGWSEYSTSIIPYFGPGGRVTEADVHYVLEAGSTTESGFDSDPKAVPVGETEFAKDTVFGFTNSDLKKWVEEKTGGTIGAADVVSISLQQLRTLEPQALAEVLAKQKRSATFVVNATRDSDLEAFSAALDSLHNSGGQGEPERNWIHRSAASLTAVRAGIVSQPFLESISFESVSSESGRGPGGGLVVVGSHVSKTRTQLAKALEIDGVIGVELDVVRVLDLDVDYVSATSDRVTALLGEGSDVVLFTSRSVAGSVSGPSGSLDLGRVISDAVCAVVAGLEKRPKFLIAKGGITSSDVATKALMIKRAQVQGQVQAGVPVWKTGPESRWPGLSYVIYPGNVGTEFGLADVIRTCRGQ